jgi:hypothetical protein
MHLAKMWFAILSLILIVALGACAKSAAEASRPGEPKTRLSDGWVSSGGDLLEDSRNPWWVNNTREVEFCIAIDRATVETDDRLIEAAFREAVYYWEQQFFHYHQFQGWIDSNRRRTAGVVAQQKFTRVDCQKNPPLRLLFGWGTLSAEEKEFLKEPQDIIARAVRTKYDRTVLKGEGFLYFASTSGPQAVRKKTFVHPWRDGWQLLYASIHELGHIFGVPHLGGEGYASVMRETFLEDLFTPTSAALSDRYSTDLSGHPSEMIHDVFFPLAMLNHTYWAFLGSETFSKFAHLTPEQGKSGISFNYRIPSNFNKVAEEAKFEVFDEIPGRDRVLLGTITNLNLKVRNRGYDAHIRLTDLQTVFGTDKEPIGRRDLPIGGLYSFAGIGLYTSADGKIQKKVYISMEPFRDLQVIGDVDDGPQPLFQNLHRRD